MNTVDPIKFRECQNAYRNMPYHAGRLTATLDALALAERLDAASQLSVLYDLAWAYAMGDDQAKALPICAQFLALLEKCPTYERRRIEATCAAMIGAFVSMALPQIPLDQCRDLLEEFHRQVKKYGLGERIWQLHACCFHLNTGDPVAAETHLQAFCRTKRDEISDCEACEASNVAECLLDLGRREDARQTLQPVLNGSLTCEDQPWSALSILIHDALDHDEMKEAEELAAALSRKKLNKKGDLGCVGALLRLRAFESPEQWASLLEKGLCWSMGLWDQRLLFQFYKGAWIFCAKLSQREPTLVLALPKEFDFWQENGRYDSAALAQWCHSQMIEIAGRFDRRNGSDYYRRQIPSVS